MGTPADPLQHLCRLYPIVLSVAGVFPMNFQGLAARVLTNDA